MPTQPSTQERGVNIAQLSAIAQKSLELLKDLRRSNLLTVHQAETLDSLKSNQFQTINLLSLSTIRERLDHGLTPAELKLWTELKEVLLSPDSSLLDLLEEHVGAILTTSPKDITTRPPIR